MTRIEVAAAPGRARCVVVGDVLSPRVLHADADGARVALVAAGALLLGGDDVAITVVVGPGAWLEVVETAGTVAYPGPPSSWSVRARLGPGAALVWQGLPFVVADGAQVHRSAVLALDRGARAVVRETTVLGRAGERGGSALLSTDVTLAGRHLLVEQLDLSPEPRAEPGVLGSARVVDAVAACGFRPPVLGTPSPTGRDVTDRLDLAGPGAVARFIGADAHSSPLDGTAGAWAAAIRTCRTEGQATRSGRLRA